MHRIRWWNGKCHRKMAFRVADHSQSIASPVRGHPRVIRDGGPPNGAAVFVYTLQWTAQPPLTLHRRMP